MRRHFRSIRWLAVLLGLIAVPALASVPGLISLQGKLTDASDVLYPDGTYAVTFRIYDASSSGNVIWSEASSVTTLNGLFTTNLGSVTPIPDSVFNNPSRWLGIQVQGFAEMTPRVRLASVGFAFEADQLTTVEATGNWDGEMGQLHVTGDKPSITFQGGPISGDKKWVLHLGSNGPGNLDFWKRDPSQWTHVMGMTQNGYVGIGTTNAQMPLQIGDLAYLSLGMMRMETRGTSGAQRSWDVGVAGGGADVNGRNYSFSIDDRMLGTDPEFVLKWGTGRVGIGTLEPTEQLEVAGNIKSSGKFVAAGDENLRIIRGVINGAMTKGSGFQWSLLGAGRYRITFDVPFPDLPAVTATVFLLGNTKFAMTSALTASYVDIDVYYRSDGTYVDAPFSFIAIGPR